MSRCAARELSKQKSAYLKDLAAKTAGGLLDFFPAVELAGRGGD